MILEVFEDGPGSLGIILAFWVGAFGDRLL
jgi:hypothetical protein